MKGGANRVLIVVGDQWTDPSSTVIDAGVSIKPGYEEFEHITALLKIWGIPFDVLRLDQQNLSLSYLVDGEGDPLYGCIIWDADPTPFPKPGTKPRGRSDPSIMPYIPLTDEFIDHDYSALEKAVKEKGISLIGIGSRIGEETVQNLLGVKLTGKSAKKEEIKIEKEHFITRKISTKEFTPKSVGRGDLSKVSDGGIVDVSVVDAEVLATQDGSPVITVKDLGNAKAVWFGGSSRRLFRNYVEMRYVLRRALVWCVGFGLYRDHSNTVILIIDDFGIVRKKASAADLERARSRWGTDDERELTFSGWKYRALSSKEIEEYYVKPLKARNAVLNHYVVSGIYRPDHGYMVTPWLLKEPYDESWTNDMADTLEGLKKGLKEGVFEAQDHGYSHHGVGPWRRLSDDPWPTSEGRALPGINLTFQYKMSRRTIEKYFGFSPLSVLLGRGGGLYHHAGIAARKAGFRLVGDTYAGTDYIISMWSVTPHPGIRYKSSKLSQLPMAPGRRNIEPIIEKGSIAEALDKEDIIVFRGGALLGTLAPLEFHFHDRDTAYDHNFMKKLLRGLGDEVLYMSLNEYSSYICTKTSASFDSGLTLFLDYSERGCLHFKDNKSKWILHLSDEIRKILENKGSCKLTIDGESKELLNIKETMEIEVPSGQKKHVISLE